MSVPVNKFERLMNLVAFLLASREPVAFATIRKTVVGYSDSAREDAVEKRFDRDKKELREIGIPVEYTPGDERGRDGYYIPLDEYYHHSLDLTGEESAVLSLLSQAARGGTDAINANLRSALLKMAIDSPLGEEVQQSVVQRHLRSFTRGKRDRAVLDNLDRLLGAITGRREISFRYRKIEGAETTTRRLHPYGLGYREGEWYLVGRDLERDDMRQFKVVRIQGAVKVKKGRKPEFRLPAGFDIEQFVGRAPWEYAPGRTETAEILFHPDVAWMVQEFRRPDQKFVERDDGSGVLHLKVKKSDRTHAQLMHMLAAYSGQCAVLKPKWLRTQAMRDLEALRARYGE